MYMVISQSLKDVMELEEKIKRGAKIMSYWRQWLIDYRKQHPKAGNNPKSDKTRVVEPETMTPEKINEWITAREWKEEAPVDEVQAKT